MLTLNGWTWDELAHFGAVVFFVALAVLVTVELWRSHGRAERRRLS